MGTSGSAPARNTVPPLVALAAVVLGVVVMTAAMNVAIRLGMGLRSALFIAQVALVVPAVLALLAWRVSLHETIGPTRLDKNGMALSLAAGAALWVGSLGLLELQYAVWTPDPGYLETFRRLHEALRPTGPLDAVVSIAAIAVVPALCEELLVRGVVLPSLLARMAAGGAILLSAVVFAAIHLDPYRTLFTLVLGVLLGYLRVRTGSLVACMIAHAVLNGLTFAVAPLVDDPSEALPDPRPALGLGLLLAGSAATWLTLRFLPSLTHPTPPPRLGT